MNSQLELFRNIDTLYEYEKQNHLVLLVRSSWKPIFSDMFCVVIDESELFC